MPPEDNPADVVELAAQIGYETAITRQGFADDDETHCWANQSDALKDDWRAYARNMLALTQARLEKAEADRDRLDGAVKLAIGFTVVFRQDHPDAPEKFSEVGRLYAVLTGAIKPDPNRRT